MANVGSGAAGKTLIGNGNGASPTYASIGTNSGLTAHGVLISENNSAFVATSVGTNGQVLIGASAADPAFATLLSSDGSITFTTGANTLSLKVAGGTTVGKTITGSSGGALAPTGGNWNILASTVAAGTTPIATAGAASTLTVDVQISQAIASTNASNIGLAAFNSSQFTVDANGFVSTSGSGVLTSLTGNSGGAIAPSSGTINTLGAGSITIAGSGSTLTTELTGLTQYDMLVGQGSTTIGLIAPSVTSGVPLISQGAAAYPVFGTAVVAGGGTGSTSFAINGAVFSNTTTTGVLQSATLGNGQLLIGATGAAPAAGTITGTGITVTTGPNTIALSLTNPSGVPWTDVTTATQTLATNNGYATDKSAGVTYTLPATANFGDTIKIIGKLGITSIDQNANQQINLGSSSSSTGVSGSVAGTNVGDSITLVCITSGSSTVWRAIEWVGNWTVI